MAAARMLSKELMRLYKDPVPGCTVDPSSDDLYTWIVGMFGAPGTIYEGGYFKAKMKFPETYPMEPPSMVMMQPMWHPNIYENGTLCISILHPPGEDATSGELASERWNPSQTVATVLLSVVSMLSEPNVSSPANVDAGVMYRNNREEYDRLVRDQVEQSKLVAAREGVQVPLSVDEYMAKPVDESAGAMDDGAETSDDEKYVVQLDDDSEVASGSDVEDSDSDSDAEDSKAEPAVPGTAGKPLAGCAVGSKRSAAESVAGSL